MARSCIATNDIELELQAVLAGQVIGEVANLAAAAHIRSGALVPLLLQHMTSHIGVHLYYGGRAAQPRRVRAFIDLAIQRLQDTPTYVLGAKELSAAAAAAKKVLRKP
jgi:DNA-binding transcriptional LysR family regulator